MLISRFSYLQLCRTIFTQAHDVAFSSQAPAATNKLSLRIGNSFSTRHTRVGALSILQECEEFRVIPSQAFHFHLEWGTMGGYRNMLRHPVYSMWATIIIQQERNQDLFRYVKPIIVSNWFFWCWSLLGTKSRRRCDTSTSCNEKTVWKQRSNGDSM